MDKISVLTLDFAANTIISIQGPPPTAVAPSAAASSSIAVVAAAVGAGAFICILILLVVLRRRYRNQRREAELRRRTNSKNTLAFYASDDKFATADPAVLLSGYQMEPGASSVTHENPLFATGQEYHPVFGFDQDGSAPVEGNYASVNQYAAAKGFANKYNTMDKKLMTMGNFNPNEGRAEINKYQPEKEDEYLDVEGRRRNSVHPMMGDEDDFGFSPESIDKGTGSMPSIVGGFNPMVDDEMGEGRDKAGNDVFLAMAKNKLGKYQFVGSFNPLAGDDDDETSRKKDYYNSEVLNQKDYYDSEAEDVFNVMKKELRLAESSQNASKKTTHSASGAEQYMDFGDKEKPFVKPLSVPSLKTSDEPEQYIALRGRELGYLDVDAE